MILAIASSVHLYGAIVSQSKILVGICYVAQKSEIVNCKIAVHLFCVHAVKELVLLSSQEYLKMTGQALVFPRLELYLQEPAQQLTSVTSSLLDSEWTLSLSPSLPPSLPPSPFPPFLPLPPSLSIPLSIPPISSFPSSFL